jgi:hypothetical protein
MPLETASLTKDVPRPYELPPGGQQRRQVGLDVVVLLAPDVLVQAAGDGLVLGLPAGSTPHTHLHLGMTVWPPRVPS